MFTQANEPTALIRFAVPNLDLAELEVPVRQPLAEGREFFLFDADDNEVLRGVIYRISHLTRLSDTSAPDVRVDLALISYDLPLLRALVGVC